MSSFLSKIIKNTRLKKSSTQYTTVRHSSLWEPDYLILAKTKTPEYDLVNFQIKGYDFITLQKYQSVIHKLVKSLNLNVSECWAIPSTDYKIHTYKPRSSIVDNEYLLHLYERNVQVADVKSHVMPLLLELVVTACPPGVKLRVHNHEKEMEDNRYVPDPEIIQLEEQLEEMKKPK